MINIPNIFRPGITRKALKRKLPGQTNVTHTQATDATGEYGNIDRRQNQPERQPKDENAKNNRQAPETEGQPHIDINA